jgi:hypothetical protein
MTDPQHPDSSVPKSDKNTADDRQATNADAKLQSGVAVDAPGASAPAEANKLSADEQMALYEQDLKENDWGHQPC